MKQEKMLGKIKWYKEHKGYGYIIGIDDETYYFEKINCLDKDYIYREGEQVEFIPNYIPMDFATEVKILKINEM